MTGKLFRAKHRWRLAQIFSILALTGLTPSLALAEWSPNWDKPLFDPQQIKIGMKLISELQLNPGLNNVTFYGVGPDNGPTPPPSNFVLEDSHVRRNPGTIDRDIPFVASGKLTVLRNYSSVGCPVNIFVPSVGDSATEYWALMPLGSYDQPLSGWKAYSDDPNCGKGAIKTIEFYQGSLEGIPATFMLISIRDSSSAQVGNKTLYDIKVFVFSMSLGDNPAPYFGLYGQYRTPALYENSDAALLSEFALTSKVQAGDN